MDLLHEMAARGHEQVVFSQDAASGYHGIIAIHSTRRGPALGGTRYWDYPTTREALDDVLRLSRAMTYKAAVLGVELGGGKAVILGDGPPADRAAIFRAHGRFIQSLGGRYITSVDIGTTPADLRWIQHETAFVTGLARDPSATTGFGVFRGMQAAAQHRWGSSRLAERTVLIQGAGKVAYALGEHLHREGARLVVADVSPEKAQRMVNDYGARAVVPERIYDEPGEVFAPCALGGTVNSETLDRLRVEIIAGAANNQLAEARHGAEVEARGMLYCPDYVINGGGLVSVFGELKGWTDEAVRQKAAGIYDTILEVFALAHAERIASAEAAERLAERRLTA
ncbi:MAG: Glu/Leu/Phe/Val dehydrogenase dimerization domain-containing protein [Gemmatimonadales bacterium]